MAEITSALFCTGDLQVTKSADANSYYQGRVVWNDPDGNEFSSIAVTSEITTGSFDIDVSNLALNGLRVKTLTTGSTADRYGMKVSGATTTLQNLRVEQPISIGTTSEPFIVNQNTLSGAALTDTMQLRRSTFPGNVKLRVMQDIYGNNSGYLGFQSVDDNSVANSVVLGYKKKNAANFNGTDNIGLAMSMNGLVGVAQDFYSGHNVEAGLKCVAFDRANTQFLTLPTTSLTFTATGVTAVAIVKFTGTTPGSFERVFEFATGSSGNNSFSISRYSTNASLQCMLYNGTTQVGLIADVGTIVQDQWMVLAAVYTNTTSTLDLYQNGVLIGTTVCSAAVTDKTTTSSSYLGRSTFSANSYSNSQLTGLYIYNSKLTAAQIATITLLNHDIQALTYTPTYSYIGSQLRFKHNEKVTYWNGAYQTTTARQPTACNAGLLYDTTGFTVNENDLRVDTTNHLVGVGISPAYKLDVAGDTNVTGAYKIGGTDVLTATTLGSSVTNSSLTSVGTLANLTVSGNISATNVAGTLSTAAQPNITSVGTLANVNTTGVYQINGTDFLASRNGGSVAIGATTATSQGTNAIGIGTNAGRTSQQNGAVAIGLNAGNSGQGLSSIAIGQGAGQTNQHNNSICINAAGGSLNSDGTSRCFVRPIRNNTTATSLLQYDATSGEITYGPTNIAGTLTTAAQPNVTSVGTLTGLTLSGGLTINTGSGSPESVVTAPVGSLYLRSDGGAGTTLYVKESGTGNTGWAGK